MELSGVEELGEYGADYSSDERSREQTEFERKTQRAAHQQIFRPMDIGGGGEIRVEAKWGDKAGPTINIGASANIHDDRGNYVRGEIKRDNTGEGSASVAAGHKEQKNEGSKAQ